MTGVLVTLVWVPILAYVGWCWAGRSRRARAWAGQPTQHPLVLGVFPGMGLMLFSLWLVAAFGDGASPVSAPFFLASVLVFLFAFYTPRWWGPRWFHQMSKRETVNTRDSLNAAGITAMAGRGPGASAIKAREAFGGSAEPLNHWRGGYVYDPDSRERAHGAARWGTVDGTVTLYTEGLSFAATNAEDALRGQETVLVLSIGQITGVWVVPSRAGGDRVQRRGFWYRSWFPRLVVETGDREYLFDIAWGKAKQVAQQISTITGRVS